MDQLAEVGRDDEVGSRRQRRADQLVAVGCRHRRSTSSARFRAWRALDRRHLIVPTGLPMTRAISPRGRSST